MCEVSALTLRDLGSVAQALTVEDITCLQNFADVTSLGGYSGYNEEQLMEFAKLYLQANNIASAAALQAADISNMGHFVCGLTPEQIMAIPNAVYGESSSRLGQLEACPRAALEAWAQHAITAFGPVSSWDHGHFAEAGILLGGLPRASYADIDASDVSGWTVAGIKHIHKDHLNEVDVELLLALSRHQAMSVSQEQRDALSSERMEAIRMAEDGFTSQQDTTDGGNGNTTVKPGDGASGLSFSILSLLLAFSITALLQ